MTYKVKRTITNSVQNRVLGYLRTAYDIYQKWTLGGTPITSVEKKMLIEIAKMIQNENNKPTRLA